MLLVGLLELFIAFFCLFTDKRQHSVLENYIAGNELLGVWAWVGVDRLASAVWVPGQPDRSTGHRAAYGGHDNEAGVGLFTNRQLRVATLAMATKPAEK